MIKFGRKLQNCTKGMEGGEEKRKKKRLEKHITFIKDVADA